MNAVTLTILLTICLASSALAVPELFDSGVPRSESELMAKYFLSAQERLRQTVLDPFGTTDKAKEFRRGRASQLINQVDQIIGDLKASKDLWIGKTMPAVYKEGRKSADKQAREAGIRSKGGMLKGSFSQIDRRAVLVVARDTAANLNNAADSMGDRAKRVLRGIAQTGLSEEQFREVLKGRPIDSNSRAAVTAAIDRRINDLVAQNLIEGSPRQAIRQLATDLAGIYGGTVVIQGKGGPIEFDPKYYAEMVVRTRTREAVQTARHERLQEIGIDLVVVIGRVSDNFCSAFLGQVFSLSGQHPKYPAYDSLPGGGSPFHPNCSKSTRPFVEELATAEQKELGEGPTSGDPKKLLGMDPVKAQRAYKDLQIRQQIEEDYLASTGKKKSDPVIVQTKAKKGKKADDRLVTVLKANRGPGEPLPPNPYA